MSPANELQLSLEEHDQAFIELSFLVEVFVQTVGSLIGGASATVGRTAGKHLARKLPLHLEEKSMAAVLEGLSRQGAGGFEMSYSCDKSGADMEYGRCAIREACKVRGQELGGEMCKMYHFFVSGMVEQLVGERVPPRITESGPEKCTIRLEKR